MAQLTRLGVWWQSLSLPWRRWQIVGYVAAGDEVPDTLPRRGVMLVGTPSHPTWAALDCPCRNGHRIVLNLDSRRYPHWRISLGRRPSLRPSIDALVDGRRCHFTLNEGKIRWA